MRKSASLLFFTSLVALTLSGCVLVTDDHTHPHYVEGPGRPPAPPTPPVYRLDCSWLASWNCWDRAVAEAEACAPQTYAGRSGGVLADYGYSCHYRDGSAVYFEEPMTASGSPYYRWSFSMEDPYRNTCAWFVETETGISIGTASGVVDLVVDAGGISVICQDGTEWFNRDPYALTYCLESEWDSPGYWLETTRSATTFGLLGGTQPALFSCGW